MSQPQINHPQIIDEARKHGVPDEDLLHAYWNPTKVWEDVDGDDLDMFVGPARDGELIEVGVVAADDGGPLIVHGFRPARSKYLPPTKSKHPHRRR